MKISVGGLENVAAVFCLGQMVYEKRDCYWCGLKVEGRKSSFPLRTRRGRIRHTWSSVELAIKEGRALAVTK